jgi:hypothetical protein
MAVFILAAAYVPAGGGGGGAGDVRGSSKNAAVASDSTGLRIYSGEATRVSESEYIVTTGPVENGDYYQGYFDVPLSLQEPFVIKLDVDYPAKDMKDVIEFVIGDNIFGYQPATARYWNIYTDYESGKEIEFVKEIPIA